MNQRFWRRTHWAERAANVEVSVISDWRVSGARCSSGLIACLLSNNRGSWSVLADLDQ